MRAARAALPAVVTGPLQRLLALPPAMQRRWLSGQVPDVAADHVRQLADLVTQTTRMNLTEAERLSRVLATLAPAARNRAVMARACRALGHVAALRGRYRVALRRYSQALTGFSRAQLPIEAAITRSGALQTLMYLGDYARAHRWAAAARRVFEAHGDRLRLARLDANVGNLLHRRDRFEAAVARYQEALTTFAEIGRREDEAVVLRNLACCYIGLNRVGPALEAYARGRAVSTALGLTRLVAAADYNIAYLHYVRGDYHRAMTLYDAARARSEVVGDGYHAALCDLDQAELALELNLIREGIALASSAAQRFQLLGLTYERAKALTHLGLAVARDGDWGASARYLRAAHALFARDGNTIWTTLIDLHLAFLLVDAGRASEAEPLARRALRRASREPMQDRVAFGHFVLAKLEAAQGRAEAARRSCRHALDRLTRHPVPALAYRVWHLLGDVEVEAGRHRAARSAFEHAHRQVETLRGGLVTDALKVAFLTDKRATYERLVRLALDTRSPSLARAFEYMEHAKARTLAEQMIGEPPSAESDAAAAGQDEPSHATLAATYRQRETLARRGAGAMQGLRDNERAIRRLVRAVQVRTPRASQRDAESRHALETVQAALPPNVRLVEYYVADGQLLGWVVGHDHVSVKTLGPLHDAVRALQGLHFQLARRRWSHAAAVAGDATFEHLRTLREQLIDPLAPALRSVSHLVIVPHGPLHAVPFQALCADGPTSAATVSLAPSAASYLRALAPPRRAPRRVLLLGVADARAPFIEAEVRDVAALFETSTVVLGPEATVDRFTRDAGSAGLIHLAAHGEFRSDNPEYSAIQLADGRVTLRDFQALRLEAELVTLSGCATGRHVVTGGDELVGLSRGLLQAGARSLLVSLWDVDDVITARFMTAFYAALRGGASRAMAHQQAAAVVRRTHPHPYYWAPFVLIGDHRPLGPGVCWRAVSNPC